MGITYFRRVRRPPNQADMYYLVFRWFPKSAFSRLMGWFANVPWPRVLLRAVIGVYTRAYRIEMADFQVPAGGFVTFNEFFTRRLRPGARPIDPDSAAIVSPVDGAVVESGRIGEGRLLQAKGRTFSLQALLGDEPGWQSYEGGGFLTLYLSPRDYHRIHAPCAGEVLRFRYLPGELWTVSPAGVRGVPDLFSRNERLITFMRTAWGEVAVVKVGATVVGKIRVVYDEIESNRRGAAVQASTLQTPLPLDKGAELGRFELGSTVILLLPPGMAQLRDFAPGDAVRMGQTVAERSG